MEELPHKPTYYEEFEIYFETAARECKTHAYMILYDTREKQFYEYKGDTGAFEVLAIEKLRQYIMLYFDERPPDEHLTADGKKYYIKLIVHLQMMRNIEDRLKSRLINTDWDPIGFENLKNGVLELKTMKLSPHSADYKFRTAIPRTYLPDGMSEHSIEIWKKLMSAIEKTDEFDGPAFFTNFLLCVVHRYFANEQFMIVYGPAGAGKSTLLQIPEFLLGEGNVSATTIYDLGVRFGLTSCYRARANVVPDLPIGEINKNTIFRLKMLTGGDKGSDFKLEVEMKGRDKFTIPIQTFFIWGTNRLPKFTDDTVSEQESIGRRALLIHCASIQLRDEDFKASIRAPQFLDEVYSWMIQQQPTQILTNLPEWINTTLKTWYLDSDPVFRIITDNYVYTEAPSAKILKTEVYTRVLTGLEEEHILVPKNLQVLITMTLTRMKITVDDSNHKKRGYCHIDDLCPEEESVSAKHISVLKF